MVKFDEYLINVFQKYYTILWNRFGITKGTIMAICLFTAIVKDIYSWSVGIADTKGLLIVAPLLLYFSYEASKIHNLQISRKFKKLNLKALSFRNNRYFRFPYIVFSVVVFCIPPQTPELFWWYKITTALTSSLGTTYIYMLCVLVYDRQEPETYALPQGI